MEFYGLNIWVYMIGIPVAALFGWILWKKAMQGDDWSDPKKSWSADVDPKKGETLRNHTAGGADR